MKRQRIGRAGALIALIALSLLRPSFPQAAQDNPETPVVALDRETRTRVLEGIIARLRETYIFPETAAAMEKSLRQRVRRDEYERIQDPQQFADTLTSQLRAVSLDTHLSVHFSREPFPPMNEAPSAPESPEKVAARRQDLAWINNGFVKAERLRGNVGFLDLDHFSDPELAGETAAAAMSLLANCDALIVDLRYNPGGHAQMVALLCSYFFEGEPVHLVDITSRAANATIQSWTAPYVSGRRFIGKEVYVLTSRKTHSAAEQFAYNLQTLKRATIVGEVTRGGAHPTGRYRLTEHFAIAVPEARAVSPITKTNWEGVGVKPDVPVPSETALNVAHRMALEHLLKSNPTSKRAPDLERVLADLRGAALKASN